MDDGQAAVLVLEPDPEVELVEVPAPLDEPDPDPDPESDFGLLADVSAEVLAATLESDLAPASTFSVLVSALSALSPESDLRSAAPRASDRLSLR